MVNMMSRGGNNLNQAAGQTRQVMNGQGAGPLAQTDMRPYMNKWNTQVINRTMNDMDRARQMTQNDIGAQATAAGAFGGSRHGLVEAENNRNFAQQAGNMAMQMRQSARPSPRSGGPFAR